MDMVSRQGLSRNSAPYIWRLIATALSFSLFGLGGVLLRVLIFPLLALVPGDALARRTRARAVVSKTFYLFVRFMYRSGVLTYEVEGIERLGRPGQLVLANHPSLIDVVVLIAFIRDANCVVKQSLWDNPSMRGPIRAAGYISNSGSMDMLDEAAGALQSGQTLVIFPEGTRGAVGEPGDYKPGVAAIYRDLDAPCWPVATNSGVHWPAHGFRRYPGTVVYEFLPAIPAGLKRDAFMARLEAEPWLAPRWAGLQARGAYWKHGSVCEDYARMTIPIQIWGGWADNYMNTVAALLENARGPVKGIIGPWVHQYPHTAVPGPQVGFLAEAVRWWDRWLKCIENGAEGDAAYRAFVLHSAAPDASARVRAGRRRCARPRRLRRRCTTRISKRCASRTCAGACSASSPTSARRSRSAAS